MGVIKSGNKKKVFYGWYLLVSVWLLTACTTGMCVNSFNQFLKPMCQAFDMSRTQFSIGTSIVSVCVMGMSPFVGKVFEKFKPRLVLCFGVVCVLVGWFGFSLASSKAIYYLMAAFVGFGSNFAGAVITNIVLNNWFHAKKGFAMGFATTGSGFGSAVFNPIASSLIVQFGYQVALKWLGVIALICMLPVMILFRYKPEDKGLVPYGDENGFNNNNTVLTSQNSGLTRNEAIRTPKFWGVCFIAFSLSLGAVGVFSQISPYLTDIGYSPAKAAQLISIISFTMAGSKILFGWLNDKIGTYKNFIILVGLSVIGMLSLQIIGNHSYAYISAFMFGIAFSSTNVLAPLITVHSMGGKDFADIFGLVSFALYAGPILGGPFSGVIFDATGSYRIAFLIYAGLYVIALLAGIVVLRHMYTESQT